MHAYSGSHEWGPPAATMHAYRFIPLQLPQLMHNTLASCLPPRLTQEIDPTPDTSDFEQMEWAQDSFLTELAGSIPGIDEAMSFAEVLKQVSCVQAGCSHLDDAQACTFASLDCALSID